MITDFEENLGKLVVISGAKIMATQGSPDVFVDINNDGSNDVRIIGGVSGGFDSGDFIVA